MLYTVTVRKSSEYQVTIEAPTPQDAESAALDAVIDAEPDAHNPHAVPGGALWDTEPAEEEA